MQTTQNPNTPAVEGEAGKEAGFLTQIHDALSSVTLAIFLLIILAATSIVGTVILQQGQPEQYMMEYGQGLYRFLQFLGLDDMYRSWWFLAILGLLLVNITLCSLKRLPRTWALMTRSPRVLDEETFKRMRFRGSVRRAIAPDEALGRVAHVLRTRFGKVSEEREGGAVTLVVDRGGYGRLGAYLVHVSILILAVGAVYGGIVGFKGYVNLNEGQSISEVPLRNRSSKVRLPFVLRCDNFEVQYYGDTQQPKDYYSDLTVLRDGKEVAKKRIEVNHPLIVDGIYFYQSSYGKDPNSSVVLEVLDASGRVASPEVTVREGQTFTVLGDTATYGLEELIPAGMAGRTTVKVAQFIGNSERHFYVSAAAPDGDRARKGAIYFRIKSADIRQYTGLQVAWDPGVNTVWAACIVMMVGLYIAFFVPHRRVLARVDLDPDNTAVLMAGSTNRNPATFENDFERALGEVREALKGGAGQGKGEK